MAYLEDDEICQYFAKNVAEKKAVPIRAIYCCISANITILIHHAIN